MKPGIHVVLLVAMKQRRPGIVGGELDIQLGVRVHQHGVFQDAVAFRLTGQAAQLEAVPVQMDRMIVVAAVDE